MSRSPGKRILLVTSELAELAPVGGIAEYVLGLATALAGAGHEVRIALPAYAFLLDAPGHRLEPVTRRLPVPLGVGATEVTTVHRLELPAPHRDGGPLPVEILGSHRHLASVSSPGEIYRWPNPEPWIAFSRAVVAHLASSPWRPDVIHCQDAHTALVPVYLRHLAATEPRPPAGGALSTLTIHNLLDQGLGAPELVRYAGLPGRWFAIDRFEFHGRASCLKAGLVSADRINTVSPTYAREITADAEHGFGLEGVLAELADQGRLSGIVNGIDEARWQLPGLAYDGGEDDLERVASDKHALRRELYERWGMEADPQRPVIAFRGRWDSQKGVGVLVDALPEILGLADVVLVTWGHPGTGELAETWRQLARRAEAEPGRLRVNPEGVSDITETGRHYRLADLLIMPSRYEPCGLAQMECQRFGTLPVVRATGGLADTVAEKARPGLPSPNGWVFGELSSKALVDAVRRAVDAIREKEPHRRRIANALRQRNAWSRRVGDYERLYGRR